jgi:hypothetical protein
LGGSTLVSSCDAGVAEGVTFDDDIALGPLLLEKG